jgi:predicted TIM-barrel fold metal-dependent hydrolase
MLSDDTGRAAIRIMDRVGIDRRIILIVDWGIELGEAEKSIWQVHKEILGICGDSNDRLIGFAGVDPRRKDASELVIWAFDVLGAKGLKLHPTGGWRLSDAGTDKVVSLAAIRGMPVLVHLGKTVDVLRDLNAQPEPFIQLAERFPRVPFIAGHCGFDLWHHFVEQDNLPRNVYFDLSGGQESIRGDGKNVIDDLTVLHQTFPGRVFFGTDSPFYSFNVSALEKRWFDRVVPPFSNQWATFDGAVPNLFSS